MADIKINEKLVVSQTGTAEPVLASNVDLSSATGIPAAGITGALGSGVTGSPTLSLANVTFPAGHVLQTQYIFDTTAATAASDTSGYSTNLSIDITPASTSSKFMCFWDISWNGGVGFGVKLTRNTVSAYQSTYSWIDVNTSGRSRGSWMHLDSPNTTSAITYLVQIFTEGAGNVSINANGSRSHLTIMEIA